MTMAIPSVSGLVSQMQQNLDAINYHLVQILDTKAHDDEIERLENLRQKELQLLDVQWQREAMELEEKRKKAGQPFAEKHRQEREKIVARRIPQERDLVAKRKKEDEEILARRKAEDDKRRAKIDQEDCELKLTAQKKEEELKLLFAGEEEKNKLAAKEKELSLHAGFEARMIQLEDEMEKKVAESEKILAEKRKAINALLDAQMNPTRRPTFRRGSKRYSATPLAADVAAVLSGKPALERKMTPSKVDEQNIKNEPVQQEVPTSLHSPSKSDHIETSIQRGVLLNGSVRAAKTQETEDMSTADEIARVDASIEEVEMTTQEQQLKAPYSPSFTPHQHLPTWADQAGLPRVSGAWGMLAFREGGADVNIVEIAKQKALPTPSASESRSPSLSSVTQHSLLPTWMDQSKLPVVKGNWGMMVFKEGGAEMQVIRDSASLKPEATEPRHNLSPPQAIIPEAIWLGTAQSNQRGHPHVVTRIEPSENSKTDITARTKTLKSDSYQQGLTNIAEVVEASQERKSTVGSSWNADQSHLVILKGSHGRLSFHQDGATLQEVTTAGANPFWVDQSKLALVQGKHGMLDFTEHGKFLKVMKRNIYWADQASLSTVRGSHGRLVFSASGVSLEAIRADRYWVDQATLDVVRGSHGRLSFIMNPTPLEAVRPDPYWSRDQASLNLVRGSHGRLVSSGSIASLEAMRADRYWGDQSTLKVVRGSHGRLSFTINATSLEVVKPDPYWTGDQASLNSVRGSHARLVFSASNVSVEAVRADPYWSGDQASLTLVTGTHATLTFDASGALLEVVKSKDPYWTANQANLKVLRGSHGFLVMGGNGISMEAAKLSDFNGTHQTESFGRTSGDLFSRQGRPNLHVSKPEDQYWRTNQAHLEILRGSHGVLCFKDREADTRIPSIPEDDVPHATTLFTPIPSYYWVDQAQLGALQGWHGMLVFGSEGAATVSQESHETPQNTVTSPIETGDFFPDDGSMDDNDEESQIDAQNDHQKDEHYDRPLPTKRTSFGPGTFASLLNRAKDTMPIITNLVGSGSYSSFYDESSPVTPTDSNPSPVHSNHQEAEEPVIRSHESINHHDIEFERYEAHQDLKPQGSPHPTQLEFGPYVHQVPISETGSTTSRPQSTQLAPTQLPSPTVPTPRGGKNSIISRTRALLENASQGTFIKASKVRVDERLSGLKYGD